MIHVTKQVSSFIFYKEPLRLTTNQLFELASTGKVLARWDGDRVELSLDLANYGNSRYQVLVTIADVNILVTNLTQLQDDEEIDRNVTL